MKKIIDARGKVCPVPVVETKKGLKTLQAGDTMEVLVDNFIAVQNLCKMAEQMKLPVASEKINEDHYIVTINMTRELGNQQGKKSKDMVCIPDIRLDKTVVAIASNQMGEGDERLGRILIKGFLYALTEQDQLPETILLYNSGCYLSTEDSDSVADLKLLESQGVEIITCGTCLNHYGLSEKLAVGDVSNMYVIVEKQIQATKIIRP